MVATAALVASVPAASEDILSVLARSHEMRLQTLGARANHDRREAVLRADFVRLQSRLPGLPQDMQLVVVDGAAIAETLAGHVVVVHADLADASEGERLFMLAHEIGHVALGHWGELGAVYHKHIPGEVNQQATDAVASVLGREASQLVHGHEFAADAYAWRVIRGMGFELDSAAAVFHMMPNMGDTPTHPASRKRLAALRLIGSEAVRSAALPER
jgi:Zn-dependent protease with chaperone function